MAAVLAWIVAVERHQPRAGRPSPLDFPAAISRRALEWAEWLATRAGTRLLLNVNAAPGSPEHQRVQALQAQVLNPADAHRADARALHDAVDEIVRLPAADKDILLVLWIGHGVMSNRQRLLLNEDSRDAGNLRTWDLDSLLHRLRSKGVPMLQLGVIDSCAQYLSQAPGFETLQALGEPAQPSQYFYFAATAGATASANPFEPTLASRALESLQAIDWPPQPHELDAQLQPRLRKLASRPFRLEWTTGSGDLWSSDSKGGVGAAAEEKALRQHARASGQTELVFRHLWSELADTGRTPGELARALRVTAAGAPDPSSGVGKLARRLARALPDSAAPQLVRDAWTRTQRVEAWLLPLADLGLTLPQWNEIARRVADADARQTPDFGELGELLLWTLNMAGQERASDALLCLMLLAAQAAGEPGGEAAKAARKLHARLEQDAVLAPRLPSIRQRLQPVAGVAVLCIELELPIPSAPARVTACWLVRDDEVEPCELPELSGTLGDQLDTLIRTVRAQGDLRVELLVPYRMLCLHPEWLQCNSTDAAVFGHGGRVGLETVWPLVLRWKERMKGELSGGMADLWLERSAAVRAGLKPGDPLLCRFSERDPPAPVRGLDYLPPQDSRQFQKALVAGDPYMVWPGVEPADCQGFQSGVRQWLEQHGLDELPQALRRARLLDELPSLVLFIDEPDSNPYSRIRKLQTVRTVAG